jgi:Protein of unknown function (DUF3341)
MSRAEDGLLAEFATAAALVAAVRATRAAGYTRFHAFSPFPVEEVIEIVGFKRMLIPLIALGAGLFGAAIQYFAQYWMNAVDYPLNVGGRPLHSWPAFLPATIMVGVLWAAAASLLGMLAINRLPRPHHPVFDAPAFARASNDRFFLLICSLDPFFDRARTADFLASFAPESICEVPR